MGVAGATNFHWSETARLHLVEAVIKVEEEIRNESNGISKPIMKWTRVSRSLPLRLRRDRSYSEDKCKHMFHNLMKMYRHELSGKITKYSEGRLTELVWENLKRREDLLKAPAPTCVRGEGLKASLEMAFEERRRQPGQSRQEMTEPARGWKILRKQENLLKGPASTQAERLKGPMKNDGFTRRSINWTETALVQLVEAVIKVEVIMKESGSARRRSTGKQMGSYNMVANTMRKWDRIAGLLALSLQAKSRSPSDHQKFNDRQCRRKFGQILKAYKDELAREATWESRLEITKPVWEVLKRREYLLNSRATIGAQDRLKPAESSNGRRSSEGQSMGTSSQPAASFSSEHSNAEVLGFYSNADEKERSDVECLDRSIQTNNAGSSRGHASRSSSEFEDSEYQNQTLRSPPKSVSRSYMAAKDPEDMGKPSRPPGVRTKAQYPGRKRHSNSSARPLSDRSPVYFRSEGKSISSGHDEIQNVILRGLLKTIDLEFSHLSSWVQSRAVHVEEKLTLEMRATCETRSRKRFKRSVHHFGECRATNSYDEIIQTSLTSIFYHQIRNSFQKLRTRLTEELETVLVELTQELLHEMHKLYTSPAPSLGIRGSQCYLNKDHGITCIRRTEPH